MHCPFLHTCPTSDEHSSTSAGPEAERCQVSPAPPTAATSAGPVSPGCAPGLTHAVVVVGELEAREAEAVVGAHGVLAGAVAAGLPVTLVDVCGDRDTLRVQGHRDSLGGHPAVLGTTPEGQGFVSPPGVTLTRRG